jgi:uncharacterized protein (DUF1499 family)
MTIKKRISITALLGLITSIAAVIIAGKAVFGYRSGELHFVTALSDFEWAAYIGLVAVVLSLIGLWLSRPRGTRRGLFPAFLGLILSLPIAIYIVNFEYSAYAYPPINDITTDMDEPPSFWEVPNPVAYPGAEVAKLQRQGYPDIKPIKLGMDTAQAFKIASALARDMGWEIISEDVDELQIEAVATSFLFGFKDNVVIRLQDSNGLTQVDLRSHSSLGKIDRGANAKRIRAYLRSMKQRASALVLGM